MHQVVLFAFLKLILAGPSLSAFLPALRPQDVLHKVKGNYENLLLQALSRIYE